MYDSKSNEPSPKPTACPFCNSKAINTLAKVVTATSFWRCRECEGTWTGSGVKPLRGPAR